MRTGNKIVISCLDSDVEDVDGHAMKTNERQVSKLNSIGDLSRREVYPFFIPHFGN